MNEGIDPETVRKIALLIAKRYAGGDLELAKDVASEVKVKIIDKLEKGEPVVRDIKKLRAYIEQMVMHVYGDLWDAQEVRLNASPKVAIDAELHLSAFGDAEKTLEQWERSADISAAMSQLSLRERQVISLRYLNDVGYQQISELLGPKVGTLKDYRDSAIAKLQVLLKDYAPNFSPKGQS